MYPLWIFSVFPKNDIAIRGPRPALRLVKFHFSLKVSNKIRLLLLTFSKINLAFCNSF